MKEYVLGHTAESWYIVNSLFKTVKIMKYLPRYAISW